MEIGEEREQLFITTVCSICRFCEHPKPNFCLLLYDSDGEQFIREIVNKIGRLKDISSNSSEILSSFEGFNSLFCREGKCPLYDKQCDSKLSTRISCYKSFMKQSGVDIGLSELSTVYKKWAGIDIREIGKDLDQITNIKKSLTKGQRKKLRRVIKKARKKISKDRKVVYIKRDHSPAVMYKKPPEKKAKALLFSNSNNEWKEKISQYLTKNG